MTIKKVCEQCAKTNGHIPRSPIWYNIGRCDICKKTMKVTDARNYGIGGENGEKNRGV